MPSREIHFYAFHIMKTIKNHSFPLDSFNYPVYRREAARQGFVLEFVCFVCIFVGKTASWHSDALPTVCKSRGEAGENSTAPQSDITHAKSPNMSPVKHFEGVLSGLRHGYLRAGAHGGC